MLVGRDKYSGCFGKRHMCQEVRDKAFKHSEVPTSGKFTLILAVIFGLPEYLFKSVVLKLKCILVLLSWFLISKPGLELKNLYF